MYYGNRIKAAPAPNAWCGSCFFYAKFMLTVRCKYYKRLQIL
nr:MAG TPA: hypothetical protein [Caudoviricetes sp.]